MKPSTLASSARHLPYLALAALSLLGAASHVMAADLTVTVEGARSPEGSVLFALYDSADSFPSADRRLQAQMASASQAGGATAVFRGLPAGRYALAVFHDANGNGRLDRNLVGMPTEPFGFSNNAMGVASAPSFDKAAVEVGTDLAITIKLR
jgi:uncharacterized protein (DUF2141 family)